LKTINGKNSINNERKYLKNFNAVRKRELFENATFSLTLNYKGVIPDFKEMKLMSFNQYEFENFLDIDITYFNFTNRR